MWETLVDEETGEKDFRREMRKRYIRMFKLYYIHGWNSQGIKTVSTEEKFSGINICALMHLEDVLIGSANGSVKHKPKVQGRKR